MQASSVKQLPNDARGMRDEQEKKTSTRNENSRRFDRHVDFVYLCVCAMCVCKMNMALIHV